jgi:geranyl-CoA carboxylase alpha subunit
LRAKLFESAIRLCEAVGYKSAGTVEFLLAPSGEFYFLEVNARLQVEHPVTEMCTGLDIVRMQIELAQGQAMTKQKDIARKGHAIEARLNAEDPYNGFLPSAGRVLRFQPCTRDVRVDSGVGDRIAPEYDSLMAKFIARGSTREEARKRLIESLRSSPILGIYANAPFLITLLESEFFAAGETYTSTIDEMEIGARPVPDYMGRAAAIALSGPSRKRESIWSDGWRLE